MQKFIRTQAPKALEIYTSGESTRDQLVLKTDRNVFEPLMEMTANHCSYCDILYKGESDFVNDLFNSSNTFSELKYNWNNIYCACATCSLQRNSYYSDKLLRPDAADYDFDRYFSINFKTGALEPNPNASKEDYERAKETIKAFGLNNYSRPNARLQELRKAQDELSKNIPIDNYSYRFFVERGLKHIENTLFAEIKVSSIHIKNIRCFEDVTIPFDASRNLIVGANSRGKSTVLQLVALALSNVEYIPFLSNWYKVVRTGADAAYFSLEVQYKNEQILLEYEITDEDRIVSRSPKAVTEKIKNVLVLGYGSNRNIKYQEEKPNNVKLQAIATLFGENDYLKHIRRLNTYLLLDLHFDAIKDLINEVFRKADINNQVRLEQYSDSNAEFKTFYFATPTNTDDLIPLEALSDGFKATFVWLFDMVMRIVENLGNIYNRHNVNGVIIIDEIDLHIHPRWQRSILPTLCDLFPKIQFIVTTHSDLVAQSVDSKYIQKLILNENDSTVSRISAKYGQGSSSNFIYDDVFDVKETFDVETESELQEFMTLRAAIFENKIQLNDEKVKQIVERLISKSKQLEMIVSRELNQIQRVTGQEFVL